MKSYTYHIKKKQKNDDTNITQKYFIDHGSHLKTKRVEDIHSFKFTKLLINRRKNR